MYCIFILIHPLTSSNDIRYLLFININIKYIATNIEYFIEKLNIYFNNHAK